MSTVRNTFNKERIAGNGFLANIERISADTYDVVKDGLTYIVDNIKKSEKIKKRRRVATKSEKEAGRYTTLIHQELEAHTKILNSIHETLIKQHTENAKFSTNNVTQPTQQPEQGKDGWIQNILKSGPALGELGQGLLSISGGIVAFALALAIVNPITAALMLASAVSIGFVLKVFNNMIKNVNPERFEIDLLGLSASIVAFGLSMVIAAPLLMMGAPGLLLASGSLVLFSLAMKLVDFKKVKEAEWGLAQMGIGIVAFGLSLWAISKMDFNLENIAIVAGGIMVMTFATWMVSKVGVGNIIKGVAGTVLIGAGMLLFSLAFKASSMLLGDDWSGMLTGVGMFAVSVIGIGLVTSLVGLALPFIAAGVAGIALMGIGMIIFSLGVKSIEKMNINEQTGERIGNTLKNVFGAFSNISIGQIIKSTLALPAMLSLGLGLTALSMGVRQFAELDTKYKIDYTVLGQNISKLLNSVKDVFTEIGGQKESNKSLVGFLFGKDLGQTPVERGIASVRDLGIVLNTLADGVSKWANLEKNFPNLNYQTITNNISKVLRLTTDIFGAIGMENNTRDSLVDFIFGNDFGQTPVERGIASVRDLGNVLDTLANGISKWADLQKNFPNLNYDVIKTNISTVLALTKDVFSGIGAQDSNGKSWLEFLIGTDLGSTDVERGIASVRDMGKVLDTLADGVIKWANLDNLKDADGKPIKFDAKVIAAKITSVLTLLPKVFAEIGKANKGSAWYQVSTDMEKGLDLAVSLSGKLNLVADSVMKFDKLKQPASMFDSIAKSYERISVAIQKMPMPTLTKLNDLFYNHYRVISTGQSNDSMKELVESITKMLEAKQGTGTNVIQQTQVPFMPGYQAPKQNTNNDNEGKHSKENGIDIKELASQIAALAQNQMMTNDAVERLTNMFMQGSATVKLKQN